MKLIKINTDHYVVVDNSEIKEGDWYLIGRTIYHCLKNIPEDLRNENKIFKITHSTQPLETANEVWEDSFKRYDYITLQEIKENFCWLDGTEWEVEFVDGKLKLI